MRGEERIGFRIGMLLDRLCARFVGHWLVNVEENVARCRICGSLLFCSHATAEQFERLLLGKRRT